MLTSIILVTYNKLDYTKQCIESIRQRTDSDRYELIAVDNGSTDGTPEWLAEQRDVRLIANAGNAGFPRACNQGLAAAAGDLLMLLNNDTVVTVSWLEGLTTALLSAPNVGAVGPVTNAASYVTSIPVPYATMDEMEEFAEAHNHTDPAKWEERLKLIGFCLLMKREAYEQVGGLDEQFGIGNFEDDDICLRMRLAGYKLLLCKDTFIHHYGSVSFGEDRTLFQEVLTENTELFKQKWSFDPAIATTIRLDLLDVVRGQTASGEALRILEVGCGCGGTLLALKHRCPEAELFGAERNEQARAVAEATGFKVYSSGRPDDWEAIGDGTLDGILIGEAHAYTTVPAQLTRMIRKLRPGGWIVSGFMNAKFYRYANRLADGESLNDKPWLTSEKAGAMLAAAGVTELRITHAVEPDADRDEAGLERAVARIGPGADRLVLKAAYFLLHGHRMAAPAMARERSEGAGVPERALSGEHAQAMPAGAGHASEGPPQLAGLKEQNDVSFTGERLVVNSDVKSQFRDVYDEHMVRYEAAAAYVPGLHVLDAACGAGYGSRMLHDAGAASVTGVDIDHDAVELAQRDYGKPGIMFLQGDVLRLPFAGNTFDAVVSFETIEHVESGAAWIREAARVLRPGGLFIVSTPNRAVTNASNYFEEQPFNPHHRFEYKASELIGDLLPSFTLEALYGQNWIDDSQFAAMRWLRQTNGMAPDREERLRIGQTGSELLPFHAFRSGEPMYIVAVCRKRIGGVGG
ncbi:methyltransferase domain-containing protein [Paenibacillus sp. MMS18-CY102]|uniref:methyltransferase domain-containing protein n=1 Tax=Paenibacillus sp. MMS18-CY102 TaxID=2682849 RepID=UPI00136625C2|nr:methyltransferase domain-containing protein [Paenibacillus sp. MMS18-CY102]MWC26684.1 methyltransferase domain-containing protein [Paenibacillus sp. MMS18-CY102]